ncbi:uncharacterized protein LOC141595086 [Silene latifolia]|uniref:uncharacterized protein LOC141595086 n=1 Tax=Silene latifolia TaxID=37657 RepID=UPI003D782746
MNMLSLNCRGLGRPDAVGGLRNLIRKEAPTFLFLCETKLRGMEFRKLSLSKEEYECMVVDNVGRSGGLALLWKRGVTCKLRSSSVHHIDVDIELDGTKWRMTGFYGWPTVSDRYLSWELLRDLGSQAGDPWMCIGDFNEILYSTEMKGGMRPQWQVNNFRDAVDDCGLQDIEVEGYGFTFDNGQEGEDNRQSRLDRALCTEG